MSRLRATASDASGDSARSLLMIPGPVEISPGVREAAAGPPPSHTAPELIEAFGRALTSMRRVWRAGGDSQPLIVAGGGTVAMDSAVSNLVEPGDRTLVVNTGYFSDRITEMLRRAGAEVETVTAPLGDAPTSEQVGEALEALRFRGPVKALVATHVDTSTGVRVDPEPLARLAREAEALSIFDGVCATAGEPFEMEAWGADVYLTASQKAVGLPPGLALMVVSPRALETRQGRQAPAPPMYLDWHPWLPIHRAYEEGRPSYFSTPATTLVRALDVGLREILDQGLEERWITHRRGAEALRAAWQALGLEPLPVHRELQANTLSAIRLPKGTGPSLVGRIGERGVVVAGGLHPEMKDRYFRVGHMGWVTAQAGLLLDTVRAVGGALTDSGLAADIEAAVAAARGVLG